MRLQERIDVLIYTDDQLSGVREAQGRHRLSQAQILRILQIFERIIKQAVPINARTMPVISDTVAFVRSL